MALFIATSVFLAEGFYFTSNFDEIINSYDIVRKIIVLDGVGFVAILLNFMVIAAVIYKSSKVVGLRQDPLLREDVSLLSYMR